jgi:hypothetical protein
MSLVKQTSVDQIEIVESGIVQVRTATTIFEDGLEIGKSLHRHTIIPGNDYSAESDHVKAICSVVHTPEVVEAFKAATAAQGV